MAAMANMGHIDLKSTLTRLEGALHAVANEQKMQLETLRGLALAEAYRQARDPEWDCGKVPPGPSKDRGVALARTLGLLDIHHQMGPALAEVHALRRAAADAQDGLRRLLQADSRLRQLGQTQCPLLQATTVAGAALQAITVATLRMGTSLTELPEELRNSELLLNATRELSEAFRPMEIADLIDDRGKGNSKQRLDRVRRRLREDLPKFLPGYSEGFLVPGGKPEADVSRVD